MRTLEQRTHMPGALFLAAAILALPLPVAGSPALESPAPASVPEASPVAVVCLTVPTANASTVSSAGAGCGDALRKVWSVCRSPNDEDESPSCARAIAHAAVACGPWVVRYIRCIIDGGSWWDCLF